MKAFRRLLLRGGFSGLAISVLACLGVPAAAKVAQVSDQGFVVRHLVEVPVDVDEAWDTLLKPAGWWDSDHTWSGDAANLSIDPRAGGCFCEILPNPVSPNAAPRGSVEHMRVVYIERPRVLRMVGALGPLQADAVNGTLTIQLKAADGGKRTQVLLEYVVGGYARAPYPKLASAVDGMLGEQVEHLAARLGGAFAAAFPLPEQAEQPQAQPRIPAEVLPLAEEPPKADEKKIIGR
ncbi:SRPBCC family protein [Novosphingobium mangrovi (ex Huang et al. 2023)]|uniref:SRPBCC family protein n=1 Tax=Novosphingobium mangrovi (ex Huang et al. 2023) TaxID=2976432 RepID=A0ABT2I5Q7_9SPHN|nr:SRPBCC family protein [Novosphingobium mangrovi (ex Huang et al. 2023)]MCT2400143.1 SRPBCC family protein [Novosphingobium mangrovi (ex Huang et al. 2023)]